MLARGVLAARRRSSSAWCSISTVRSWGSVIGDDGLDGSSSNEATGEAHLGFQRYVLEQAKRGVILAVCSKNDETNAREPFEKHPEMALKLQDISCFGELGR